MTNPPSSLENLHFLKLGGSLITDKTRPHTPRLAVIARLAGEIASARLTSSLPLVLGHGSGSFGHITARRYGTRQGVTTPPQWQGFLEVWQEASALNRLVMEGLQQAGLPAISFPPSAMVVARDGQVTAWDISPLQAALQAGLLPVIYGDVVFDTVRGGTILSTEDLFVHLAKEMHPKRLLLAGIEPGVWADFPACTRLIPMINPANLPEVDSALSGSAAADVTGGMKSKVHAMLALVEAMPGLVVSIFSGEAPGDVEKALTGEDLGTRIIAG